MNRGERKHHVVGFNVSHIEEMLVFQHRHHQHLTYQKIGNAEAGYTFWKMNDQTILASSAVHQVPAE